MHVPRRIRAWDVCFHFETITKKLSASGNVNETNERANCVRSCAFESDKSAPACCPADMDGDIYMPPERERANAPLIHRIHKRKRAVAPYVRLERPSTRYCSVHPCRKQKNRFSCRSTVARYCLPCRVSHRHNNHTPIRTVK